MMYGFDFGIYLVYLTWPTIGRRESKMMRKMVNYSSCESPYRSVGKQGGDHSPSTADTLRILRVEIRSCTRTMTGWFRLKKYLQGLKKNR